MAVTGMTKYIIIEREEETMNKNKFSTKYLVEMALLVAIILLYRKFLKSSEIVYNRLEIKNDIAKERRGLRHDVVYEVFCFGLG